MTTVEESLMAAVELLDLPSDAVLSVTGLVSQRPPTVRLRVQHTTLRDDDRIEYDYELVLPVSASLYADIAMRLVRLRGTLGGAAGNCPL
jgi:hypothetical protein